MKNYIVLFILTLCCFGCASQKEKLDLSQSQITHQETLVKEEKKEDNEITPDLFPETSRAMHNFNMQLIYALKPALDEYKEQKIATVHKGVVNFLKNLQEPVNAGNAFLQLDVVGGLKIISRFVINSTAGMFGFMDAAGAMGIKRDERDFGQTLGVWGVPMGGFFVVPIYAQTTTRDFVGKLVDTFFNPMNGLWGWATGLFIDTSTAAMSIYQNYDFILATNETSIDSYTTFKTMFLQNREKVVNEYRLFGSSPTKGDLDANTTSGSLDYDFDMEF